MASKNLYYRRLVAESAAKSCLICFKPSSTVLISDDQTDWFYVCPGHLNDTKFAIPKDAEDLAKKKHVHHVAKSSLSCVLIHADRLPALYRHDEEIDKEIEAVKKEFEEKMRKKLKRQDGAKPKEEKKKEEVQDEKEEKEKDEKLKELNKKKESEKTKIEGNRVFELQKHFFMMRIQKKRDNEQAKRTRERLRNPTAFPSVPSGDP